MEVDPLLGKRAGFVTDQALLVGNDCCSNDLKQEENLMLWLRYTNWAV